LGQVSWVGDSVSVSEGASRSAGCESTSEPRSGAKREIALRAACRSRARRTLPSIDDRVRVIGVSPMEKGARARFEIPDYPSSTRAVDAARVRRRFEQGGHPRSRVRRIRSWPSHPNWRRSNSNTGGQALPDGPPLTLCAERNL